MYPSESVTPSSPPPPMPRQSKVILQRQYREKEGGCFNELRDVITELTGEEVQTRQEILRKAIDLLLAASQIRKLREAQPKVVYPTPYYETFVPTAEDAISAHIGHPAELSPLLEGWQSTANYVVEDRGQQHHLMFNANSTLIHASSRGHNENWSYYF